MASQHASQVTQPASVGSASRGWGLPPWGGYLWGSTSRGRLHPEGVGQTPPFPPHTGTRKVGGTHPTRMLPCYHPQRSWGKVIFSHVSVILFTGGGSASVHAGIPPPLPWQQNPLARRPPPQKVDPPWQGRPPQQGRPPPSKADPPWHGRPPPLCSACWEIRSTSGWYASYWNAILVFFLFLLCRQLCVLRLLQSFTIWHSEQYNSIKNGFISEVVLSSKLSLIL